MFEIIRNSKIHNFRTFLSSLIILIGIVFGFSGFYGSWVSFIIAGLLALIMQFDFSIIKKLFFKMKRKKFKYIILTIIFSFISIIIFTLIGKLLGQTISSNIVIGKLENLSFQHKIVSLFRMIFSLAGEEIIVASVFFSVLKYSSFKFNEKKSYFIAIVIICLFFGLLHFRAYNWNLYQMFFVIGLTRFWFEFAWIKKIVSLAES